MNKQIFLLSALLLLVLGMHGVYASSQVTQNLTLNEGNNVVNFTILPENTYFKHVLAPIFTDVDYILVLKSNPMIMWDKDFFGSQNDEIYFNFTESYMIILSSERNITITGYTNQTHPTLGQNTTTQPPVVDEGVSMSLTGSTQVQHSRPQLRLNRNVLDSLSEISYLQLTASLTSSSQINITNISVSPEYTYQIAGEVTQSDLVKISAVSTQSSGSAQFTVQVAVPANLDAVDESGNQVTHVLTVDVLTSEGLVTQNFSFTVQNRLELDRIEGASGAIAFSCSTRSGEVFLRCGRGAQELPTNRDFTLTYELENTLDADIEDIRIRFDSNNRDVDTYDTPRLFDIRSRSDYSQSIRFETSGVRDRDFARIDISATGFDVNGARHGFRHELEVEFDEESNTATTPGSQTNTELDALRAQYERELLAAQQLAAQQNQTGSSGSELVVVSTGTQVQPTQPTVVRQQGLLFDAKSPVVLFVGVLLVILLISLIALLIVIIVKRK